MIPAHHYQKVFVAVMSFLTSAALSLVFLIREGGAGQAASIGDLLAQWLARFAWTWVVVLPAVLLISPLAKRIAAALVRSD